ncbi:hypothetical protein L873DRAFT_1848195 [Choiromyces venosus 120613-1]|uniref:Uncharacterized protein n=1 Tax=Choiromyces venosus 120613-1 TaxID=1336337 RepID=A0A3N4J0F7_9PEZI|nr:hypothetical protein L873DRAFT_1848195 [Choiromyces venosus 120613-1]
MEYNKLRGFDADWKGEKRMGGGGLAEEEDDGMDFDSDMLDMYSSTNSTLKSALSRYECDVGVLDGQEVEGRCGEVKETFSDAPDSKTPMKLSPVWESWCSSCGDVDTEELGSPSTSQHQQATITDEFCGINMSYPNDQGLDSTFASSFKKEEPSDVSSPIESEPQVSLVDVRQPRLSSGEHPATPSGMERFPLRYDPFSFRFHTSLPEAPINVGFTFSPRLDAIPQEKEVYENISNQDGCESPQSRPPKTAKRHYRSGTISPDRMPLNVPVKMSRITGETPPAGLRSVEPYQSNSENVVITSLDTTCLLCTNSNIVPRYQSSLDENHTEGCDQKLCENICGHLGRAQEANREVGHRQQATKNADMQARGTDITSAQGGLQGENGVEDHSNSARVD